MARGGGILHGAYGELKEGRRNRPLSASSVNKVWWSTAIMMERGRVAVFTWRALWHGHAIDEPSFVASLSTDMEASTACICGNSRTGVVSLGLSTEPSMDMAHRTVLSEPSEPYGTRRSMAVDFHSQNLRNGPVLAYAYDRIVRLRRGAIT
ncbi:hypothetical protein BDZ89DRAFT_1058259 [Hymenopellis radicata]|nr:hypothetical protein BDZ89DRAFT_1058259 [Hymenopellis radicata]